MKSYDTIDGMWHDLLIDLLDHGDAHESRNGYAVETIGWSGRLLNPSWNFLVNDTRKLSAQYACGELLWYLSQERHIDGIKAYAPSYVNFANEKREAEGAYGWRWANNWMSHEYSNQLDAALALLKSTSNTRQCVVSSWHPSDLYRSIDGVCKDTPCTLTLQFLVRNGRLSLVASMRSNDAWLGMPYDVFCFTTIQQLMATALGLGLGSYVHSVGSMHVYDKHLERAKVAANADPGLQEEWQGNLSLLPEIAINALTLPDSEAVELERAGRLGKLSAEQCERLVKTTWGPNTLLDDAVLCCWDKTVPRFDAAPHVMNPNLRRGLR